MKIFQGVRPSDYLLAALLSVAGVFLMWTNIAGTGEESLIHPVSTTSWLIVPAFLLVTLPILWRRRNILAVVAVTVAATAAHVLAFGWLTRCGVVLPLAGALAYAIARFSRIRRDHVLGLAGVLILEVVMLLRDASAGLVDALGVAVLPVALFYGIGLLVQTRVSRKPAVERATV